MFALMEEYCARANQHTEDWQQKCVAFTNSKMAADAWQATSEQCYGKRYFVEVPEVVIDEQGKTFEFK